MNISTPRRRAVKHFRLWSIEGKGMLGSGSGESSGILVLATFRIPIVPESYSFFVSLSSSLLMRSFSLA